jgi:undecaprenyl-diphosphatase
MLDRARTYLDRYGLSRYLPTEAGTLVVIGLIAGLGWAFAGLVDEVLEQETHAFDSAILLALRVPGDLGTPIGPDWLEHAFIDITALGGTTVLTMITIIAVSYLLVAGKVRPAIVVALSIIAGTLAEMAMKVGFDRPRPDLVPHLVPVTSLSFPSGHAMLSAVTYLTIGTLLAAAEPRLRLRVYIIGVGVVIALLIGMSRVFLGVHWPTDVLAGWTAGAIWALGSWMIAKWFSRPPKPGEHEAIR